MPQNASLAMSGVKGAYNTAYLASDERDMNTIVRDNMLTLKAKSALITAKDSGDVQVLALNGDIFVVGTVSSLAGRDGIIRAMQQVQGAGAVKGHLRLRDPEFTPVAVSDGSLENRARMALSRHLLHKNNGVEVQAVEGEVCLMGVVGTHAEALDLIQYVESVTGARVLSLLAIRNEYATGRTETNRLYLLEPSDVVAPRGLTLADETQHLPRTPVVLTKTAHPTPEKRLAESHPASAPAHNKARAYIQQKLITLAKRELNLKARAELLSTAAQVAQDRDLSIADRLSVAAAQATQQQAKVKIEALLALY
jgi:osmotically-inducible protein OsmY